MLYNTLNYTLNYNRELLRLLPRVTRARDFHLYLENRKRLTDLWLQGGRAILGHKPPRFLLELKNTAERGLFSTLPHQTENRMIKALREIFPGRAFRLYLDSGSLNSALEETGLVGIASVWRPFLETPPETQPLETPSILIPVPPWPLGPDVLVLEKSLDKSFPAGDLIPPVLLAPATRTLYNLAAALKAPGHGRMRYQKIEKVLNRKKFETSGSEGCLWRRRGIYLTVEPDIEAEKYKALFLRFLDGGYLIPPSPMEPAILPAVMSKGEEAKLAELLGSLPF